MMTNKVLIGLSASVLALAACGQTNNKPSDADVNVAMGNEALDNGTSATPLPTSAQGFANLAAASDRFEIESSKLAQAAAHSAGVKDFAAKMITAHEASTDKLKATAGALSPPLNPDDILAASQQQDLDGLKNLDGADFDAAYAAAQVKAHQQALDALKDYVASGDTPALKDFANSLIPTVTEHLNMAKGLK
jgi:putative membrane protein